MPRVSIDERLVRDRLIFDLWVAGQSERAIADDPGVQLAPSNVHEIIKRERLQLDAMELIDEAFAAAYRAAEANPGDKEAAEAKRRLGKLLLALQEDQEAAAAAAAAEREARRRAGVVVAPIGTGREAIESLARQRARELVGEGEQVGDVRLEGSKGHEGYQYYTVWSFTFEVVL
jgi:hypothetical protein